ncbi:MULTISPECIES: DNA translocase FtsK [Henriciella]|jgi:S-DNA-T family DNA segregation ATPase FtsK/SpoIIIE|uniref:DNA translocase FtsK n=1 Tax=Henriciella pelagia TaxID=1977912 RepID=A0ABQ1JKW3_9PROT|nr:DNA translocase FtsK [Henriciella pelagia]GGB71526.1 DNA translocase FtsK [Henriciella pelagia]
MANSIAQTQNVKEASDPVWRILTGTAAFAIGVFLCGSVGSYQSTDPSLNASTALEVQNLFGGTGAIVADLSLQTFGFASWMAGLALMVGGAMRAVLIGAPRIRRWFYGAAFVLILSGALASFPVPASWPLWTGLGGMFGDGLYDLAVVPFKALLLPMPELLAGLFLGTVSLLFAFSALGFRRGDARLLQTAAASSGRRAARSAGSLGGKLFGSLGGLFRKKHSGEEHMIEMGEDAYEAPAVSRRTAAREDLDVIDDEEGPAENNDEDLPIALTRPKLSQQPQREPEKPRPTVRKRARSGTKILPSIDLLQEPPSRRAAVDEDGLLAQANRLSEVLREFGVRGRIKEVRPGPVVTLFELEPAAGVKSARVISLADDIARSMSAVSARVAVIPGKNAIGIELPNEERETVYFRSLLSSTAYTGSKAPLPMALGEDIGGTPTVVDLSKMPHLLIAGTTGSGKSVGVNAMILSLIYRLTPEQCRFIMIDPKMLELSIYEGIPHLLAPVVTDPKKAVNALQWAVREMESRYELMSKAGVRNLAGFNEKAAKYRERGDQMTRKVQTGYDDRGKPIHETEILPLNHIPNIVVVIDEMADLMMVAGKEIEGCIQRLAQMARAAGIHLITATQRPSVDVITGTIKANFPTRISYMVTTKIDSRTILGEQGAEQLLGMGDLLYQAAGVKTKRLHGPFVSDEEVETVVNWLREQGEPDYNEDILEEPEEGGTGSAIMDAMLGVSSGDGDDDLYAQAMAIVVRDKRASTSYLQRRLKVGYNKAATLIERLEEEGVISAPNHAGKREILVRGDPSD